MVDEELRALERTWRGTNAWSDWIAWARASRRAGDEVPWRFLRAVQRLRRFRQHLQRIWRLARPGVEPRRSGAMRIERRIQAHYLAQQDEAQRLYSFLERIERMRELLPRLTGNDDFTESVRVIRQGRDDRARVGRFHAENRRTRPANLEVPQDSEPTHFLVGDSVRGRIACPSNGNERRWTSTRSNVTCERCLAATAEVPEAFREVRRVCNECDQDVRSDGSCGCSIVTSVGD